VKTTLVVVGLSLLAVALVRQNDEPRAVIHGIVLGQDRQPAKRIGLTAEPLGVALGAKLPNTRTNDAGEYRFENVPWWGKYTVYADDEDAGYSSFSTGPVADSAPPEVEVTAEHPEGVLNVVLPPKAGFIQIHLTNRKTGAVIPAMRVALMSEGKPASPVFTMSCYSTQVILIPPEKNFLLHVTSDGFREWNENAGKGKLVHLASGANLKIDVQLEAALPHN
jgi:hypothetical protein